jgi:hypothetical protein
MKSDNLTSRNSSTNRLVSHLIFLILAMSSLVSCGKKAEYSDPTAPVRSLLEAQKNNDFEAYKKAFFYEPDESFTQVNNDLGVISLSINKLETSVPKTKWFIENYTDSELAKERGWTKEFISGVVAVIAEYSVDYDNTKVPFQEGVLSQTFYVARESEDSPWLILDIESPHQ